METKRGLGIRMTGAFVAAMLCLGLCLLLGVTRPAAAATLQPGTYQVSAKLMKVDNPAEESVANPALVSPVRITVDTDQDYTVTLTMKGLDFTVRPGLTVTGYMSALSYWDGSNYVPANVLSTQEYQGVSYPKELSFPLVNKMAGDEGGFVRIQTVSPGGSQPAYLSIAWSELLQTTSGGVSYAVSGKAATVTSISRSAKSASVKSTVTIGGKSYKVTSIKAKAAYKAKNLKKVTLGKNLKSIGKNAFKGIAKKATFKCPKSKLKTYKKLVRAAGAPSSTKYKAA